MLGIWYGLSDVQLAQFGIEDQVQCEGYSNKPLSCANQIRNQVIAVTRSGAEQPFATYKHHYGLARTRRRMGTSEISVISLNLIN